MSKTTPKSIAAATSADALSLAQLIIDGLDEAYLYDQHGPNWRLLLGLSFDPETLP